MAVLISENVEQNLDGNERNRLASFRDAPGYGGQRLKVKIGTQRDFYVNHVTYGAGSGHITVFYETRGQDYYILGLGKHAGKKAGKTIYEALWDGHDARRVTVTVLGTWARALSAPAPRAPRGACSRAR